MSIEIVLVKALAEYKQAKVFSEIESQMDNNYKNRTADDQPTENTKASFIKAKLSWARFRGEI